MHFFDVDNPVMRFIMKIGNIWLLNILWLFCSLPVFTIGASTTALLYSSMKLVKDEGYPVRNFFRSFRENFLQATAIFLIYAAAAALLVLDLMYWNRMDRSDMKPVWAVTVALLIPWCMSVLYVFAVQAKFVHTVPETIRYAMVLSVRHLKETVLMLVVAVPVVWLNMTTIVLTNYVTLLFGAGLIAYLFSFYYIRVFSHYIPGEIQDESGKES